MNVVPSPTLLTAEMFPFSAWIISFAIDKPSPEDLSWSLRDHR